MIRSFKGVRARPVFTRQVARGLSPEIQRAAYAKLAILEAAGAVSDLRIPPGNRLEKLSGDRAGQYSTRINDQWRICFTRSQGDACNVEIVDYR
jgi:toxin HigB-1